MRMRLVLLLCAALALTVGVTAATAGTTIGQAGTPSNAFAFNSGVEEAPDGYVVPAGRWVVGSLNTQAAGACFVTGVYNLQVLRPLGGNPAQYKVLGDTGHQTDPCDGQLHSYPVNIPVQAGDVLGVYVVSVWQGLLSGGGRTFTFQQLKEWILFAEVEPEAGRFNVSSPCDSALQRRPHRPPPAWARPVWRRAPGGAPFVRSLRRFLSATGSA